MTVPFDNSGLSEKFNREGRRYFTDKNDNIVAKECTKCETVKGLDGFTKDKGSLSGHGPRCKECLAEYRRKNRDRIKEYYRQNRERELKRAKEHYQRNLDNIREYRKEYYRQNPDYFKDYYRQNRDRKLKRMREWRQQNQEYLKEYRRKNLLIYRLGNQRRRARKRNLPDDFTQEQKQAMLERFGRACALTGDKDSDGGIHLDHVIPIASGHGGTTLANMIPLRADLNISKSNRNIFDWFADNRERFGLEQRKFDELIEYLADINDMTTKEYEEYVRWCHDNPRTIDEINAEQEDDEATV